MLQKQEEPESRVSRAEQPAVWPENTGVPGDRWCRALCPLELSAFTLSDGALGRFRTGRHEMQNRVTFQERAPLAPGVRIDGRRQG